jgi:exopolyphosphatase / guanosine-5'-triphosphate,3'-diphosphate pyrophosphatase
MTGVRVAVLDVGSNTVRLLVASAANGRVVPVLEERAQLGLGREIERCGGISRRAVREVLAVVRGYISEAVRAGAARTEVLVTAPGRQAENGADFVEALAAATGGPVHALSAEEEGRLAFAGAVASLPVPPASVSVCDVGGGSTQLVFGTGNGGPVWFRSLDIGSLRLAQRYLRHDPPRSAELEAIAAEVESCFSGLAPPLPRVALAAGGTARGLRRLVGRSLGERELVRALDRLTRRKAAEIARQHGLDETRVETLPAGAVVLAEVRRRLGVPLVVARAGLREGAALELLRRAGAEAA